MARPLERAQVAIDASSPRSARSRADDPHHGGPPCRPRQFEIEHRAPFLLAKQVYASHAGLPSASGPVELGMGWLSSSRPLAAGWIQDCGRGHGGLAQAARGGRKQPDAMQPSPVPDAHSSLNSFLKITPHTHSLACSSRVRSLDHCPPSLSRVARLSALPSRSLSCPAMNGLEITRRVFYSVALLLSVVTAALAVALTASTIADCKCSRTRIAMHLQARIGVLIRMRWAVVGCAAQSMRRTGPRSLSSLSPSLA